MSVMTAVCLAIVAACALASSDMAPDEYNEMDAMGEFIKENLPFKFKMGLKKLAEKVGEDAVMEFFERVKDVCMAKKMGLPDAAVEQKKRRAEAAAEEIANGDEDVKKFLCIVAKTKIALAIIFKANMELWHSLSEDDMEYMHDIGETLGEELTHCLCKLHVRLQLIQCGINCIKSKLSLKQRVFLDMMGTRQVMGLRLMKAKVMKEIADANDDDED